MEWTSFISPVLTAVASFIGAWFAARLALRRFYDEKLWERKTEAYTAIFEALHEMSIWFDGHLNAHYLQKDFDTETSKKMYEDYNQAKDKLSRRIAAEVWLIPDSCRERIQLMNKNLANEPGADWFQMLDAGAFEILQATNDLTKLVRADLKIKPSALSLRNPIASGDALGSPP